MVFIGRADIIVAIDMCLAAQFFVEWLLAVALYLDILIELAIMRLGHIGRCIHIARPMVIYIQLRKGI